MLSVAKSKILRQSPGILTGQVVSVIVRVQRPSLIGSGPFASWKCNRSKATA